MSDDDGKAKYKISNWKPRIVGNNIATPQGGVISPLLANIYLNDFCQKIAPKPAFFKIVVA